ncbi:MAG: dTDP-4-dehydrorhamnose 3,5-epimerase [Tannerella sp.]|jgi:dTDP-4-dehydrorhamnose 3,5-epimerase|nr:dTDP-4-dehydrorhamnose 3,5-epimerase [Tannerella sp.]
MNYTKTAIPDVWLIEPVVFKDARGYFMEVFKQAEFERHIGKIDFVQENESCSTKDVLRGLHYQLEPYCQAKLVRVIEGAVLDVAVDIRQGSPTFGQHVAIELSAENRRILFVPHGFAHGFRVLSEKVIFTYKVDNLYTPAAERGIYFDDPAFGINWNAGAESHPSNGDISSNNQINSNLTSSTPNSHFIMSDKDKILPLLRHAEMNFTYSTQK